MMTSYSTDNNQFSELRQAIQSGMTGLAMAAVRQLAEIPDPEADQILCEALEHDSPKVRSLVALTFNRRPSERSARALLARLKDPDEAVTLMILTTLGGHLRTLEEEDDDVVKQIIQALSFVIASEDSVYLRRAAEALSQTAHADAVLGLLIAIRANDKYVHHAALKGLRQIWENHQDDEALAAWILDDLFDGLPVVRTHTQNIMAQLVGQIGGTALLPVLFEMLTKPDPIWQAVAIDALSEIARQSDDQTVQEAIIRRLGNFLPQADLTARGQIVEHFGDLGCCHPDNLADIIAPWLVECLEDDEYTFLYAPPLRICELAKNALEKIYPPAAPSPG